MNRMRKAFYAALVLAISLPAAAWAQSAQGQGPPPEMRAQMDQVRQNAQTAVSNDLSADHRSKVQAIVAQVNNGSLSRQDASAQIDAILSPAESKAILADQQKTRAAMRQIFQNANEGGGPGGPGGYGGRPPGAGNGGPGANRTPDAGRFVLMVFATPQGNASERPKHSVESQTIGTHSRLRRNGDGRVCRAPG